MLDRICREGLRSCWLLRRELAALNFVLEFVLLGCLTGEESREANGDAATELFADDCFDALPSGCVVEEFVLEGATDASAAVRASCVDLEAADCVTEKPSVVVDDCSMVPTVPEQAAYAGVVGGS